jgi:hypothetical protein
MGSGGGVPYHATYVTQRIGSGWSLNSTIFSVEVKGKSAEGAGADQRPFVRLSEIGRLTLPRTLC